MASPREKSKKIKQFINTWTDRGNEKSETQSFWISLLADVLDVKNPTDAIKFEVPVKLSHQSYIDAYIPYTRVLIEQKSRDVNLRSRIKQSDGQYLTPFQQAKRYDNELPVSEKARYIVVCNFHTWHIYDMEHPHDEPMEIEIGNLERDWQKLAFLYEDRPATLRREEEVSMAAGKIIGSIYDAFLEKYGPGASEDDLRQLNVLCVRLVFCLYAEDAGLFGNRPDMFHDYLAEFKPSQMRGALQQLFKTLNTPAKERDRFLDETLAEFPYVNGGLFADDHITIPPIDEPLAELILQKASLDFDWSVISPTIFGGVFESTLNPQTRQQGGMHYTSVENIHRVIDPLFVDSLTAELDKIISLKDGVKRNRLLDDFTTRLSQITILDPACGSGNFLTETYLTLRRLENRALRTLNKDHSVLNFDDIIKVNIGQFYGIEINDFAVTVTRTALWIAEAQMLKETESIVNRDLDLFPLKSYANIVEANALLYDWTELIEPQRLSYIVGNPPFIGARNKTAQQLHDLEQVFGQKYKGVGEMDYVAGWYKKAADYMQDTDIRAALVSTNSITQGEQVAPLWRALWQLPQPIHIDYAWRTFRWDSEAADMAHVHVVIIGFSCAPSDAPRYIYRVNCDPEIVKNINPNLANDKDRVVGSRPQPICDVPPMGMGCQPIDNGYYLFTRIEMEEFIKKEPQSATLFRPWYGAEEFINGKERFCLLVRDCTPAQLRSMPLVMKQIENVRDFRLKSKRKSTLKLALTPTRFQVENIPTEKYLLIPSTTSDRREYIPMAFMEPPAIGSNATLLVPGATLYHFGVMTSSVHMDWMRAVCGRLETRYRYSKEVVYNNFPWPEPTEPQRRAIEDAAAEVLEVRKHYADSSLADLYHPIAMPLDLLHAHQRLDKAVARAYGLPSAATTEKILECLFSLYSRLV